MIRVGFVGLGMMGRPIAARLVSAGLDPVVYDVADDALRALAEAGARTARGSRDVAERCDVIGVCVPADPHVRAVCEGPDGLFAGARPGTVVAVHGTIRPRTILALGRAATARGLGFVDACISGGVAGAADGSLVYMVGGSRNDLERCRPMLEASGKLIVHTGPLGTATRLKLCNNVMTYLTLRATWEAWSLATKAGLSADVLERITGESGVLSDRMRLYLAGLRLPSDAVASDAMQRTLASYAAIGEKDLDIALELAAEVGVELPGARLCAERMREVFRVAPRP